LLAQTQKQNRQQNKGVFSHKGAQNSAIIKFVSVLTTHTGATCNQPVELAKDWSSDCLEKQNLLVVEICGFLGRLQSLEGLAQSNNNAKLNYSAKHVTIAAGNECKSRGARGSDVAWLWKGSSASCLEKKNENRGGAVRVVKNP
jgi:hypothetical protein